MIFKTTYPDSWLRVIGSLSLAHFVETIGRAESIAEQWMNTDYWLTLVSGGLVTFIIWTLISLLTTRLDQHYDWLTLPMQRISLQFAFGVVIPSILIFLFVWALVFFVWDQNPIDNEFHITEFPVVIVLLILINGIYFAWYLYNRLQEQIQSPPQEEAAGSPTPSPSYLKVLLVNSGKMQIPIQVSAIQFIIRQGDYTLIKTSDREFIDSVALDELVDSLDPIQFFRANRQVIIAYSSCKGIRSLDFGKLEVQTEPSLAEPLVVSQKKARLFREWMARR